MPGTTGPNLGLVWGYAEGEDGWGLEGYNPGFALLDTLVHTAVLDITPDPPTTPADGDRYIVDASATGIFAGHEDALAVWLAVNSTGWVFYMPKFGWRVIRAANGIPYIYDGLRWLSDSIYAIAASTDPSALLGASQALLYHRVADDIAFPLNFVTYRGMTSEAGGTADATASTVIDIELAPSSDPNTFDGLGTITIGAGGVTPTFTTAGGTAQLLNRGDVIRILAPATPDATFKGFYCTLIGYRR